MLTIGQVARKFSLSRSTLLYYDRMGVLSPSGRSVSNYRLYSAADLERMERIVLLRSAGLSLEAIARLLEAPDSDLGDTLERRLASINSEIQALRNQQQVILDVLGTHDLAGRTRVMNKETWVSILESAGLDDAAMHDWHREFEKTTPEGHQDFLESLGIAADEIAGIRRWSRDET